MSEQILKTIDDHIAKEAAWRGRVNPAARAGYASDLVAQTRQQFSAAGPLGPIEALAPAQLKDIERKALEQFDAQSSREAQQLREEQAALSRSLEAAIAAVSSLADPLRLEDSIGASASEHAIRRIGLQFELDRAERRLAGKTPSQVAAAYEAADDRLDHALKFTIEDQQRRGWLDIRLADGDAPGLFRLRDAIAKTQRARLERDYPTLVTAQERLDSLRSSVVSSFLLREEASRPGSVLRAV